MWESPSEMGRRSRQHQRRKFDVERAIGPLALLVAIGGMFMVLFGQAMMVGAGVVVGVFILGLAAPHMADLISAIKRLTMDTPSAHEKTDKLARAVGLKWQRIPERRRWVTKDTADPEHEEEQPQVLRLEQN